MEAYQKRVIAEKEELDTKIEKLKAFLDLHFENSYEIGLLMRQFVFMTSYSNVLGVRLAAFK